MYDSIVIGGGCTGTSVFRDLAMRGQKVLLLERGKISSGTSSHSHQNLVGGMRYVVKDPQVAAECARENDILRKIVPQAIGPINNYFIGMDDEYASEAIETAKRLGVVAKEVDICEAMEEIPDLNRNLELCVETSDCNIDVNLFCRLNCNAAIELGSEQMENVNIHRIDAGGGGYSIHTDKGVFESQSIVNATGPWINRVAELVGQRIQLEYSKGTIVIQDSLSPRGLQFLHPPGDADAYIVHNETAWIGTTSTKVADPSDNKPEDVSEYLTKKMAELLPKVVDMPILFSFAGVRPLYGGGGREASRDFHVIESPKNVFHVVGGKLTTARLMAEKVADQVTRSMGSDVNCRTHIERL